MFNKRKLEDDEFWYVNDQIKENRAYRPDNLFDASRPPGFLVKMGQSRFWKERKPLLSMLDW